MNAIIIPAYKPSENILPFVRSLAEHFSQILVVNDGSGTEYDGVFSELCTISEVVLLQHEINQGKGQALKTAFSYCLEHKDVEGVITVDADGQHLLVDILKIDAAMKEHPADLVMGCRQFDDKTIPARSRFGNNISRVVYRVLCGINVSDTQTGLRGLPFDFLQACMEAEGSRYEYETNMLIAAVKRHVKFYEVPITTVYEDNNSSSHFHPVLDSIRIYSRLIKYSLVSLLSVLVEFVLFTILVHGPLSIMLATYVARGCSCLFNFTLNRKVVFQKEGHLAVQFIKYLALVVLSGTLSGAFVTLLDHFISGIVVLLKMVVDTLLYFMNYYIQKKWVFASKKQKDE